MNQPNLPLHPSQVHPLTGKPIRALWRRPDGRLMWPVMGGAPDDAPKDQPKDDPKDAPKDSPKDEPKDAPKDQPKDDPKDLGFPKDTPVAEMKPAEQAAYWQHQARKHEDRNREWLTSAGGKTPAELKAEREELEKLRKQNMTDQEKAVEEAKDAGRAEAASQYGPKAVKTALELLLGDMPQTEKDAEIELLDLGKFLTETGDVDTDKVRRAAAKIAPAGKGGERLRDFGAGDRRSDKSSGVASGRDLYKERHGSKSTSTSTS